MGGREGLPRSRVVRLAAGTPAFSVIRTAAWYTPFAALRAAVPTWRSAFPYVRAILSPLGYVPRRASSRKWANRGFAALRAAVPTWRSAFPCVCAILSPLGYVPRRASSRKWANRGFAALCAAVPTWRSAFPCQRAILSRGGACRDGRHPGSGRTAVSLRFAQRCRPEVYTLRTSFSGPSGVRGTEGPYFTNLLADPPGATNQRYVFRTPTPDCASTGLGRDGTHGRRAAPSSSQYRPQRTSRRLTSPRGASLGRTTAP